MKLARIVIENFRQIDYLELDFTDSLERVRDISILVGPNASGKTTILDAIAVGLGYLTEFHHFRTGFELTPQSIVRYGQLQAQVTYHIRFSDDELTAVQELYQLSKNPQTVPSSNDVVITWQYPAHNQSNKINTSGQPAYSWTLFKGRKIVANLLSTQVIDDWSWFEKVGSVFTFDQQRTGMNKTIPQEIWNIIRGNDTVTDRKTNDPREILLWLSIQSTYQTANVKRPDAFKQIQEWYTQICKPHQIKGIELNALNQPNIIFSNGKYDYRYGGLSSGEEMTLMFLIRMVTEYIHQSIVLIDEIELHQHPLWQQKLLYQLPQMGKNNQIIATTHSAYLRDFLPSSAIYTLGELGD